MLLVRLELAVSGEPRLHAEDPRLPQLGEEGGQRLITTWTAGNAL